MVLDLHSLSLDEIKRLNRISVDIQKGFNSFTAELISENLNNLAWRLHPLNSRHPYWSDLYNNICKILLISQLIRESNYISRIIVENHSQYFIMKRLLQQLGSCIELKKGYGLNLKRFIKAPLFALAPLIISIKLLLSRTNSYETLSCHENIILLDTFILQNSIDSGKYIDRYYNNILDYAPTSKQKRIYLVPTILGKFKRSDLVKIKKSSREQIIYKHDWLKLSDYVSAYIDILRVRLSRKNKFNFHDVDFTKLVFIEYKKHRYNSFRSLLNYYFAKRLKQSGVEVVLLIDWNENQPIDKALIKGVRDYFPGAYIKGYQGHIVSTDYNMHLKPTDEEVSSGVIPDEICVVGEGLIEGLKEYTTKVKITAAPAFRFSHVHNYEVNVVNSKDILVLLPIGYEGSMEILGLLIDSLPLLDGEVGGFNIKPHPALNLDAVIKAFGERWPNCFNVVGGNVNEQFSRHGIIIGSGSSTLLEGMSQGKLAIVPGYRNGIDQNPIPGGVDPLIWKQVFTPEDMAQAIVDHSNTIIYRADDIKILSQKIKNDYFLPVNESTVGKLLSIN